jgi:hypothetical protein
MRKERSLRFEQARRHRFGWIRLPASNLVSILNIILAETLDETFSQQLSNDTSAVFAASILPFKHRFAEGDWSARARCHAAVEVQPPTPWRNKICDLTVTGLRIARRTSEVLI